MRTPALVMLVTRVQSVLQTLMTATLIHVSMVSALMSLCHTRVLVTKASQTFTAQLTSMNVAPAHACRHVYASMTSMATPVSAMVEASLALTVRLRLTSVALTRVLRAAALML